MAARGHAREPEPGPGWFRRLSGLIQASHPFPIVMVMSLTLLIGVVSAGRDLDGTRLTLALASMLSSQLAIGWSNDYLDRERDGRFQPEKPVPSGLVPASWLAALVPAALAFSCVAAGVLGTQAMAWLLAGSACGFAYNLALKDSRLSFAPYVVAFAVLPPFVWSATDSFRREFLWLYPIGAPLAVAAHLANTIPDIEADTAAGLRGISVRLGRQPALAALYGCLLLPAGFVFASLAWLNYDSALLAGTLVTYFALVLASTFAYRRSPFARGAAMGFRILAPAAVILAAGWLAAL